MDYELVPHHAAYIVSSVQLDLDTSMHIRSHSSGLPSARTAYGAT